MVRKIKVNKVNGNGVNHNNGGRKMYFGNAEVNANRGLVFGGGNNNVNNNNLGGKEMGKNNKNNDVKRLERIKGLLADLMASEDYMIGVMKYSPEFIAIKETLNKQNVSEELLNTVAKSFIKQEDINNIRNKINEMKEEDLVELFKAMGKDFYTVSEKEITLDLVKLTSLEVIQEILNGNTNVVGDDNVVIEDTYSNDTIEIDSEVVEDNIKLSKDQNENTEELNNTLSDTLNDSNNSNEEVEDYFGKSLSEIIANETPTEWIWEDSFARPLERKEEWFELFLSTTLTYKESLGAGNTKYLERYFALEGRRLFQDYGTGEIIVYLGGYLLARIIKSPDIIDRRYYVKEVYNDFDRATLIQQIQNLGNMKIDIEKMMAILDEYEKVFFNCISDVQNSLDNAYYTWLLKDTVLNGQYPDIKLVYEYDSKYIIDGTKLYFSFVPFYSIDGRRVSEDVYMNVVYDYMEYDNKKLIYAYLKNIFTFGKGNLNSQDGNSFYSYVIENNILYKIGRMYTDVRYNGNPIEVIE